MTDRGLTQLDQLESESIYMMREAAAQFERVALLFSGGKDSICLVRLAEKAFRPGKFPFFLLHIDTGHNFPETLEFRDRLVARVGEKLVVRKVQDSIDQGRIVEEKGPDASRNVLQTTTLLDAISEFRLQALFGGARRDEEKARAKERKFSFRNEFGQWDPRNQRPELWEHYNGKIAPGEHIRVFPLSNWTEMDVWNYLKREQIEVPSIYYAHRRKCVRRTSLGLILPESPFIKLNPEETYEELLVRCRTVGDMTCTGMWESPATDMDSIIAEIAAARVTERGGRVDDRRSESAMEERKRHGYF